MGELRFPEPVLLVVAAFGRHETALAWARARLERRFGFVALASPPYDFHHTKYYDAAMGSGLKKQFWAFHDLIAADRLAEIKRCTNDLEEELAGSGAHAERRPINLDPGVLSLGKFLLATTKDQAHRIYLRDGIFAEVTLRYQDGAFEPWPWTYADYREPTVRAFFQELRDFYRERLKAQPSPGRERTSGFSA